jgi:hypothetical protein
MSAYWRMVILAAILFPLGLGKCDLWGQEKTPEPSVLHIQQSQRKCCNWEWRS